MESINRILSGNPVGRKQLLWAAAFVSIWFVIDVIEFVDWAVQKVRPTPVVCVK